MFELKTVAFLLLLKFSCSLSNGADTELTCAPSRSCILPCMFQPSSDPLIHWINETSGSYIHSYYYNQDQLNSQDHNFGGRTSLFKDQISRGNASLMLTRVRVQDGGRYKCYTSTNIGNKESFISLKIEAPVSKISIYQEEKYIICSSERIYPNPNLTWSIIPPSNNTLIYKTTIHETEEKLYNISSSLLISDSNADLTYSCTLSAQGKKKTATFKKDTASFTSSSQHSPRNRVTAMVLVGVLLVVFVVLGIHGVKKKARACSGAN